MANLQLALKSEYFDQIKNGEKHYEFRLYNDYWKKRLENKRGVVHGYYINPRSYLQKE